jgi:hypothetical protein
MNSLENIPFSIPRGAITLDTGLRTGDAGTYLQTVPFPGLWSTISILNPHPGIPGLN